METLEIVKELKKLPGPLSAVICDSMLAPGVKFADVAQRVVHDEIKPIVQGSRIVGPAFTVEEDALYLNVLDECKRGDVLVINARGAGDYSVWGVVVSSHCKIKGVEGVIIDGATRDVDEIRAIGYPVFARFITPKVAPVISSHPTKVNVPIVCGGVPTNPEDIIVGDSDGVVVIPREKAEEILEAAKFVSEIEMFILDKCIKEGMLYTELSGIRELWAKKETQKWPEWTLYREWLKKHK